MTPDEKLAELFGGEVKHDVKELEKQAKYFREALEYWLNTDFSNESNVRSARCIFEAFVTAKMHLDFAKRSSTFNPRSIEKVEK
jgi:hypothetical protein